MLERWLVSKSGDSLCRQCHHPSRSSHERKSRVWTETCAAILGRPCSDLSLVRTQPVYYTGMFFQIGYECQFKKKNHTILPFKSIYSLYFIFGSRTDSVFRQTLTDLWEVCQGNHWIGFLMYCNQNELPGTLEREYILLWSWLFSN